MTDARQPGACAPSATDLLIDPGAYFARPVHVVTDELLSEGDKRRILSNWEAQLCSAAQRATDEAPFVAQRRRWMLAEVRRTRVAYLAP